MLVLSLPFSLCPGARTRTFRLGGNHGRSPGDFLAFINKQGFEEAQALDVGLYEILSPKEFLGYFSAGPSIYDF